MSKSRDCSENLTLAKHGIAEVHQCAAASNQMQALNGVFNVEMIDFFPHAIEFRIYPEKRTRVWECHWAHFAVAIHLSE